MELNKQKIQRYLKFFNTKSLIITGSLLLLFTGFYSIQLSAAFATIFLMSFLFLMTFGFDIFQNLQIIYKFTRGLKSSRIFKLTGPKEAGSFTPDPEYNYFLSARGDLLATQISKKLPPNLSAHPLTFKGFSSSSEDRVYQINGNWMKYPVYIFAWKKKECPQTEEQKAQEIFMKAKGYKNYRESERH